MKELKYKSKTGKSGRPTKLELKRFRPKTLAEQIQIIQRVVHGRVLGLNACERNVAKGVERGVITQEQADANREFEHFGLKKPEDRKVKLPGMSYEEK